MTAARDDLAAAGVGDDGADVRLGLGELVARPDAGRRAVARDGVAP